MRRLLPLLLAATPATLAQDLYDPATLRTIQLQFQDPNWWSLLDQNYESQTYILADMTVEGLTYPDVGVRIRGNTSYKALPAGSEKISLNVEMDFVHAGQDLLGYDTLNLNNGFSDPTFTREVAYNNFIARYIPNGRSNHVLLELNGQSWGVYGNVQQFNKDMLRDYFADEDGMRVKCPNAPNGPGLRYVGSNVNLYTDDYEIKETGGLADPWGALIAVCDAVTNTPLNNWEQADTLFAIDPSIWSIALENLFTDDDSYINKGADFVTYRNPVDGRMHLLQTDGNESWHNPNWSPLHKFNSNNKPFMSHLLDVPELRQRYFAHMRTAFEEFDWAQLGPTLLEHRDRIDAHVQADTKKIYTYQMFLDNFFTTVNLGGGQGPGTGPVPGLKEFVDVRENLLANHPELSTPAPVIPWVTAEPAYPDPGDPVFVTALVEGPIDPIAKVELWYLPAPGSYQRVAMADDGASGDGAAGDGVYGVQLPVAGTAGQAVRYYVAATSANAAGALTFHPRRTEIAPAELSYSYGSAGIFVTEYLYSGTNGEFVELTNTTPAPIDLTGWSLDDQSATPGIFDLSPAGTVAPGESILVTNGDPAAFSAAWGLTGVTVLGGNLTAPFGRNDQINVYDQTGTLVARVSYGDEDFEGSVRAQNVAAQICTEATGVDDPYAWTLGAVGDAWACVASSGGDVGSPGLHLEVDCFGGGTVYCEGPDQNGDISIDNVVLDGTGNRVLVTNSASTLFAYLLVGNAQGVISDPPGAVGDLCLGGSSPGLGRYVQDIQAPGGSGTYSVDIYNGNTGGGSGALPSPPGGVLMPGDTWNFQGWNRQPAASPSNFTKALSVTFQ